MADERDERDERDEPGDDEAEEGASAKQRPAEPIRDRNKRLRAEAAQRRAERHDALQQAQAAGLDAGERVDDAVSRARHEAWKWLRLYWRFLQWGIVAVVLGFTVWYVWDYQRVKALQVASDRLASGVAAENGVLGNPADQGKPNERGVVSPFPIFQTVADREAAALEAYKATEDDGANPALGTLATLGSAGVHYREGKYKEAAGKYAVVAESRLAASDLDVKGRALEGQGLAQEAAGERPAALATFSRLGELSAPRFQALALLHRARLLLAEGKRDEAKALVTEQPQKLHASDALGGAAGQGYLVQTTNLLLGQLDPSAVPESAGAGAIDPARLQEIIEQLKKSGGLPKE